LTTAYARHRHPEASLATIRVAEAMHRGVVSCRTDANLGTVVRLLAAHRIHAVAVEPGEDAEEWGIVSDLDVVAALSQGAFTAKAGEIASAPSVVLTPDDTLSRAVQLMHDHAAHHVIVLGRGLRRPVGVISTLDVADAVVELPEPRF
jgi:CBS domain-containing protein